MSSTLENQYLPNEFDLVREIKDTTNPPVKSHEITMPEKFENFDLNSISPELKEMFPQSKIRAFDKDDCEIGLYVPVAIETFRIYTERKNGPSLVYIKRNSSKGGAISIDAYGAELDDVDKGIVDKVLTKTSIGKALSNYMFSKLEKMAPYATKKSKK